MTTGTAFLIAARQCEIRELQGLMRTSSLVRCAAECVHALQKERGLSNLWLGSGRAGFAQQREAQAAVTQAAEAALRAALDALDTDAGHAGHGARLFSRIAYALQGLDALPALRSRIAARTLDGAAAVRAFAQLIGALLAVVFEAADSATEPGISRQLVAMFHFLQGKEFAGQERATGAVAFTAGAADAALQQHWQHLVESQERCFAVFADFAGAEAVALWRMAEAGSEPVLRLRRLALPAVPDATQLPARRTLDAAQSRSWFDACTARIDAMQQVVERLADDLLALCAARTAEAEADLQARRAVLATGAPAGAFFDAPAGEPPPADAQAPAIGPQLERSVLALVQEQSRRLQAMGDELDAVRATLSERKVVERAKGLLMAHRRLSEAEAHKMLRQTAMNQGRRLIDVAESVLAMADYLPEPRA